MATPITFSVPAQQRSGTFSTQAIAYPGGYSTIYWELAIPNTADFENTANRATSTLLINGVDASSVWQGGRSVNRQGVTNPPPAVAFDISGVPAGVTLQVTVAVNNPMKIGIQNGLIS